VGYLEKVYENALVHRLQKKGFDAKAQVPLEVHDEDATIIGDYFADVIVNDTLIVELKACNDLSKSHEAQLFNYLKTTSIEHGLLINFGSEKFQIKKYIFENKDFINQKTK
jgi:GxxExxY protein